MLDPRDMRGMVRTRPQVAEETGFDAVMVSEQTMLGGGSAVNEADVRRPADGYAAIGNQDPFTPGPRRWPRWPRWPPGPSTGPGGGRGDHPAAAPSAAAGQGPGHDRPAGRGPAGGPADRLLAAGGVRGARAAVPPARRHPGRAPGRDVRRSGPGRRRSSRASSSGSPTDLLRAEGVAPAGPADVVRRGADARRPGPPDGALRVGVPPVRGADRRRPGDARGRAGRRSAGTCPSSSWSAAPGPASTGRTRWPTSRRRWPTSRRSSSAATRPSA